jgi:hypothetical protein
MTTMAAKFDTYIPGSDLFFSEMMAGVTDVTYIGVEDLNGVTAHHPAFRKSNVDWQLWVQTGDAPLSGGRPEDRFRTAQDFGQIGVVRE